MAKTSRVLVVPDLHAPAIHPKAFDFVRQVQDEWQTDHTVFLGDAYDLHAMSYHQKELGTKRIIDEVHEATEQLQPFYDHFSTGKVDYLVGNHCHLICRKAVDAEIPEEWIRPIKDIFGMPKNWKITERYGTVLIDGVAYRHGDAGASGGTPAITQAKQAMRSTVIGHFHAAFGVNWYACDAMRIFGMNAGSLCDPTHLMQKYGRKYTKRPILGMGVVLDGTHAYCEVMPNANRGVR